MAKLSKIVRNNKKRASALKYRKVRIELRDIIRNPKTTPEERFEAQVKLAKLPRLSLETRVRNRCNVSGRPRAYLRRFQMSRIAFRQAANSGLLPGVIKASW